MGHPRKERVRRLLQDAKEIRDEIVLEFVDEQTSAEALRPLMAWGRALTAIEHIVE